MELFRIMRVGHFIWKKFNGNNRKLKTILNTFQPVFQYTCIIDNKGGTNKDILNRLKKARNCFALLNKLLKIKNILTTTKIRILFIIC